MSVLVPVPRSEKSILKALITEYLTELRGLVDAHWNPEIYPFLDAQWTEPGRHPFFIRKSNANVGLVIVRDPISTGTGLTQLSEFYVIPRHRGTGLAMRAAHATFRRFPGQWELQVHKRNERGRRFWRTCIEQISTMPPKVRDLNFDGEEKEHHLFKVL